MRHSAAVLVFAAMLAAAAPDKPRERGKPAQADSATGCIDESGETYVLTGDRHLKTKYTLHGANFNDDNFARYVGYKVKVTGKLEAGDVFRVRQIEKISETCAPATEEREQK